MSEWQVDLDPTPGLLAEAAAFEVPFELNLGAGRAHRSHTDVIPPALHRR